jgi:hypothetical protein
MKRLGSPWQIFAAWRSVLFLQGKGLCGKETFALTGSAFAYFGTTK